MAPDSAETPLITVLIPVHNNWAITLNALRSLVATANDTRLCSALRHRHKVGWC